MKSCIEYCQDGEARTRTFEPGTSEDEIFTEASRMICFGDCSGVTVDAVVIAGKRYTYGGWLPGMRYKFYDEAGHPVWQDCFPEWDH